MLRSLSIPYILTDQGFVFKLHDPIIEPMPRSWQQALINKDYWHDGVAFAVDQPQSLYLLRFFNHLTISVSLVTKSIDLWPEDSLTQDALKHILIDQLVPRIFAAQGALVLHAGAIVVDERAIVFMGESGAGKSTLVASLYLQGLKLVNDDAIVVSVTNGNFSASASHHRLRLLPDSLHQLFDELPESIPVSQSTSKRRIVISDGKRHAKPDFPLGALFFIGNESARKISLRQLSQSEAMIGVIKNSFALNPTDADFATKNFYRACDLAKNIPAYELNYPRSYEVLPDVHRVILNKLNELRA